MTQHIPSFEGLGVLYTFCQLHIRRQHFMALDCIENLVIRFPRLFFFGLFCV